MTYENTDTQMYANIFVDSYSNKNIEMTIMKRSSIHNHHLKVSNIPMTFIPWFKHKLITVFPWNIKKMKLPYEK